MSGRVRGGLRFDDVLEKEVILPSKKRVPNSEFRRKKCLPRDAEIILLWLEIEEEQQKVLEEVGKNSADLLILDMIMDPGIDGYET